MRHGTHLSPGDDARPFRHRELSPTLGRWTRQDPLGYVDGANTYQVTESAPTRFLDPSGLHLLGKVSCDGKGNFMVHLNPDAPELSIPCVREIVEAHEEIHVEAWKEKFPDSCWKQGIKENGPVPWGWDPWKPNNLTPRQYADWVASHEKTAWQDTLSRIRDILNSGDCQPVCEQINTADGGVIVAVAEPTASFACCGWLEAQLPRAERLSRTGIYGPGDR